MPDAHGLPPGGPAGNAGITVTIRPLDVAVIHAPAGTAASIGYGDGTSRTVAPDRFCDDEGIPVFHVIPGTAMGWGCWLSTYHQAGAIARGRHKEDRAVWQKAARLLAAAAHSREGRVLYLEHEPRDWCGQTVPRAVRIRRDSE